MSAVMMAILEKANLVMNINICAALYVKIVNRFLDNKIP